MIETEIEKAKRYLLGEYTMVEELGLSEITKEFEGKPNTAISRAKLKKELNHILGLLQAENRIINYDLDVTGCAYETTNIAIRVRQSSTIHEYVKIDFDIK